MPSPPVPPASPVGGRHKRVVGNIAYKTPVVVLDRRKHITGPAAQRRVGKALRRINLVFDDKRPS